MYAVVKTGGKQIRVATGDKVKIEKVPGQVGDEVRLDQVLMVGGTEHIQVGAPQIEGAFVMGRILEQDRSKKIIVFKFKRRKGYQKRQGHRQDFTRIEITGIEKGAS